MSYYVENQGGFYIAAHDGRATDKDLNFFKNDADSLCCEIAHFHWKTTPGTSLELDYPVVVAALSEGSWYEAADRYRSWATEQAWCERGTRQERIARGDSARWLTEEIGTVGMWWPFRENIESAVRRTRQLYGAPLLHLELCWQNEPSVRAAHSEGDRFGPFYFPYLCLQGSKTFEARKGDVVFPPASSISPQWKIMCAAQPEWRRVFIESGVDLVRHAPLRHSQIWIGENKHGCEADCLYFDIGPCAAIPTHCYAADHDHPPGAGRGMTEAHLKLAADSQRAASKAKGEYVPIGTECISEPLVSCMDLYYPRNAGFGTEMELAPYIRDLTWLPDGNMEAVPLFSYVYHEYQGVPVQGIYGVNPWRLDVGSDYHTWAEARSILWGGLFATFALPDGVQPRAARVRYLRSLVAARTGFAKEYLCYGRMQPPPPIQCETFQLDHGLAEGGWYRKLRFSGDLKKAADALELAEPKEVEQTADTERGQLSVERWVADVLAIPAKPANQATIEVPAVASAAYTSGDTRLGILLVSVQARPVEPVSLSIDPERYQLAPGEYQAELVTQDGAESLGRLRAVKTFDIALPAREAELLEVTKVE
jgi:hypothetical protein